MADHSPTKAFLARFRELAKAAGYKLTSQREALVKELARITDHPTAETLLARSLQRTALQYGEPLSDAECPGEAEPYRSA